MVLFRGGRLGRGGRRERKMYETGGKVRTQMVRENIPFV
jgi:hypothetical protein